MQTQNNVLRKLFILLIGICTALSLATTNVTFAGTPTSIEKVDIAYDKIDYKPGDALKPTFWRTDSTPKCLVEVPYETWTEIKKTADGNWVGTTNHWYSDPEMMDKVEPEHRLTKFEAGKSYRHDVYLEIYDDGYIFDGDKTNFTLADKNLGVPNKSSQVALNTNTNATKAIIFEVETLHFDNTTTTTDKVIKSVDIANVNTNLTMSEPVRFSGKAVGSSAEQIDIKEEAWERFAFDEDPRIEDIIKSTEKPRAPIKGGRYYYSIVLTAKDGYVFSDDFSNGLRIREGSGVSFILNGVSYTHAIDISPDKKTLTVWEFMQPVTPKDGTKEGTAKTGQEQKDNADKKVTDTHVTKTSVENPKTGEQENALYTYLIIAFVAMIPLLTYRLWRKTHKIMNK